MSIKKIILYIYLLSYYIILYLSFSVIEVSFQTHLSTNISREKPINEKIEEKKL